MDARTKRLWLPRIVAALSSVAVFAILVGLRSAGYLQNPELMAYDVLLRSYQNPNAHSDVVLLGITDEDTRLKTGIVHVPLFDDELANVLARLMAAEPKAIGIDVFRDTPVPVPSKPGEVLPGRRRLQELAKGSNVGMVYGYLPGIVSFPDDIDADVGFADFDGDRDGKYRRAMLAQRTTQGPIESFACRLCRVFLDGPDFHEPDGTISRQDSSEGLSYSVRGRALRKFLGNEGAYCPSRTNQSRSSRESQINKFQFLLDFRGPRQHPMLSLADVLDGRFDPSKVRGKIVLIGMVGKSAKDYLPTPVDPQMFGIELHAAVVDQLLRASRGEDVPVHVWPKWCEGLWILIWSMGGAVLGFVVRSPWRLLPLMFAGLVILGSAVWLSFGSGWWLPSLPPAIGWVASGALVTSYISAQERGARAMVMQLFSRFVSDDVAQMIWDQQESFLDAGGLRPRELAVTVLFADLKGFSAMCETLSAQQVMDWLNHLMDRLSRCVDQNQGIVSMYAGDQIMALFGAPVPRTTLGQIQEDARNAVQCALDIRREFGIVKGQSSDPKLAGVKIRVGIFSGNVVAGSLGSAERLQYTVIGEVVNIASRLESFNKELMDADIAADGCRILIGKSTLALLGETFATRYVATAELPGMKLRQVEIHGVMNKVRTEDVQGVIV